MRGRKPTRRQLEEIHGKLLTWPAVGWSVDPKKVGVAEAAALIESLAAAAHVTWVCKVKEGAMADEDVSPGEGLLLVAGLVRHLGRLARVRKVDARKITATYDAKRRRRIDQVCRGMRRSLEAIVPGYFGGADGR